MSKKLKEPKVQPVPEDDELDSLFDETSSEEKGARASAKEVTSNDKGEIKPEDLPETAPSSVQTLADGEIRRKFMCSLTAESWIRLHEYKDRLPYDVPTNGVIQAAVDEFLDRHLGDE